MATNASPVGTDGIVPTLAELVALRAAVQGRRPPRRGRHGTSGQALSPLRGRGMEYAESREYAQGDDARHIDWRLTARSGKPHTKLFQAERERLTLLVADTAPSLYFGTRTRFKSVQAARAAALVAWAAVHGGDRIGAVGFGPGLNAEVKPGGGPRGALRVLRALVEWDAIAARGGPAESLSQALQRAHRLARPGTRVIVLTDGFSADAAAEGPLSLLAGHCDVATVLLSDALEQAAPPPARYAVRSEAGRVLLDFAAARTRARWPQLFAERRALLTGMLQRRALRSVVLDTRAEPDAVLMRVLGLDPRQHTVRSA